MIFQAASYKAI